jgi:ketosteroid isomerase-like protein
MRKKLLLMSVLAMVALPPAYAEEAREPASLVAPWNAALESGKLDELLKLYAKDALVLLPNGQAVKEPKAILEFWRHLLATHSGRYALDVDKVIYAKDDTVVSTLRWSNRTGDLKYSYDGVIYSVFKRQPDGSWKAQVQRWN